MKQLFSIAILATIFVVSSGTIRILETKAGNSPNEMPGFINKSWWLQQIRFLQDNISYYYEKNNRGESNQNFDHDYINFQSNGKGQYHRTDNVVFNIQWEYHPQKNSIIYTIDYPKGPLTVIWENITFSEKEIRYSEFYTLPDGTRSLAYGIRRTLGLDCPNDDSEE